MKRPLTYLCLLLTSSCWTFVDFDLDGAGAGGSGASGGGANGGNGGTAGSNTGAAGGTGGTGGEGAAPAGGAGGGSTWECVLGADGGVGVDGPCGETLTGQQTLLSSLKLNNVSSHAASLHRGNGCGATLFLRLVVNGSEPEVPTFEGSMVCPTQESLSLPDGIHAVALRLDEDGKCTGMNSVPLWSVVAGGPGTVRPQATSMDEVLVTAYRGDLFDSMVLDFDMGLSTPAVIKRDVSCLTCRISLEHASRGPSGVIAVGAIHYETAMSTAVTFGGVSCELGAVPAGPTPPKGLGIVLERGTSDCVGTIVPNVDQIIYTTASSDVMVATLVDGTEGTSYQRLSWPGLAFIGDPVTYNGGAGIDASEVGADFLHLLGSSNSTMITPPNNPVSGDPIEAFEVASASESPAARAVVISAPTGEPTLLQCLSPVANDPGWSTAFDPVKFHDVLDLRNAAYVLVANPEESKELQLFRYE